MLQDKQILLCVSGGIAAYKSALVARLFVSAGARVQVAMTQNAQQFVGALTFQALTGQEVFTDLFDRQQDAEIGHIRVADGADLVVVAPATANTMAKIVAGLADDPVTAAILATRAPILVAPAMNMNMWASPANQRNRALMEERGFLFVGPDSGFLACKWEGAGRLAAPESIVEAAYRALGKRDLAGKRIVVSAGGTREAVDPVRFLGNRSTGRMGFALALAASRRGAQVQLVAGPSDLETPFGVERDDVESAEEMRMAVTQAARGADLLIMAAAVADFRPQAVAQEKRKKDSWGQSPSLDLEATVDILHEIGHGKSRPRVLVGFAAETENLEISAQKKLEAKACDLIVANDVSMADRGFGSETNAVQMFWKDGGKTLPLASKLDIANSILDTLLEELGL